MLRSIANEANLGLLKLLNIYLIERISKCMESRYEYIARELKL